MSRHPSISFPAGPVTTSVAGSEFLLYPTHLAIDGAGASHYHHHRSQSASSNPHAAAAAAAATFAAAAAAAGLPHNIATFSSSPAVCGTAGSGDIGSPQAIIGMNPASAAVMHSVSPQAAAPTNAIFTPLVGSPPAASSSPQHHQQQGTGADGFSGGCGSRRRNNSASHDSANENATRRATHNAIERARRESLNGQFQDLASAVPTLIHVRRPSKATIVEKSLAYIRSFKDLLAGRDRYIKSLQKRNLELQDEVNRLRGKLGMEMLNTTSNSTSGGVEATKTPLSAFACDEGDRTRSGSASGLATINEAEGAAGTQVVEAKAGVKRKSPTTAATTTAPYDGDNDDALATPPKRSAKASSGPTSLHSSPTLHVAERRQQKCRPAPNKCAASAADTAIETATSGAAVVAQKSSRLPSTPPSVSPRLYSLKSAVDCLSAIPLTTATPALFSAGADVPANHSRVPSGISVCSDTVLLSYHRQMQQQGCTLSLVGDSAPHTNTASFVPFPVLSPITQSPVDIIAASTGAGSGSAFCIPSSPIEYVQFSEAFMARNAKQMGGDGEVVANLDNVSLLSKDADSASAGINSV